jgi:hypothetical protein
MGRGKDIIIKEGEFSPAGRSLAGRAIQKTSSGRHGRQMFGDISEEAPEGSRFGKAITAIGSVAKKTATGAAVILLASAIGTGLASCSQGGGLKDIPDAGWWDTDSETEMDTDTDSETDSEPPGPECGTYVGADHEAVLAKGEKELLGPVGHWMKVVDLAFGGQLAEVVFMDEQWEKVDFEGNHVEEGDLAAYFLFSEGNPTLAVDMGGIEQEITLCGVYELESEELVAHFITDNEDGFMHCSYVNSGNLADAGEYEFTPATTQSVRVMSHSHGFIPDIETGEDEECPGAVKEFVYEQSSYVEDDSEPIPVGLVSIPGIGFNNMVMLRGTGYHFCETGVDSGTDTAYLEVAESQESGILTNTFQSIEVDGLEVTWTGVGTGGEPLFSYEYPGAVYISDEAVSANEKNIYVWTGTDVREFNTRFTTPSVFMENNLPITLLSGIQFLMQGSQIVVGGETYDVSVYTATGQEIEGFRLTPAVEED